MTFFETFNPFPNKPWFLRVCSTSLLKTLWEKEKLVVTSVFYPWGELSAILIKVKIVVCRLFEFGSLKFVVWERVCIALTAFITSLKIRCRGGTRSVFVCEGT